MNIYTYTYAISPKSSSNIVLYEKNYTSIYRKIKVIIKIKKALTLQGLIVYKKALNLLLLFFYF